MSAHTLPSEENAERAFRMDDAIHDLLMHSAPEPPAPPQPKGATLPEPVFPQYPELLNDPGPDAPLEKRQWTRQQIYRKVRGWLFPYIRSRVLPGDFHPITAYLFTDYKCNLDCWYCWAFNNRVSGMIEDIARRSIDWLYDQGYQMVNSVQRLREMKAFVRMSSGLDVGKVGWYGDGTCTNEDMAKLLASTPGIVPDENGGLRFADWNCPAGQNNVVIRTDGTVAPCFPMYSSTFDWGNIDSPRLDTTQLTNLKNTCQRHCFSTLNHNLGYCYNDARVIKWLWKQAKNRFQGGAKSFED
jgi:radical SAM protein with 4Fe4S-binding SPASM domain